ncbi:MAG: peptidoglycan-associated lipoprotein Pal [Gammaproteobacteria bacterium]|nr:peptidoglycan-associated lipoprotein Pal [Gammaproteobacteria bacterium]
MELVVYFDYDVADLKSTDMTTLGRHAKFLVENTGWRVRIEGHADDRGSERYNLALGERRANAVRQMFLDQGIADSRIDVVSFGEERPAAEGTTDKARAQNRRAVVIHLSR